MAALAAAGSLSSSGGARPAAVASSGAVRAAPRAAVPPMDQRETVARMRQLREKVYHRGFAFPAWVVDHLAERNFALFEEDARHSKIFYDEGDDPQVVLDIALRREPVNIGMSRCYNAAELNKLCGWEDGAYGEIALEEGRLPPNFAVMCRTPIVAGVRGSDGEVDEVQQKFIDDPEARVHVLSVIGYAFDSPEQPDQQHFLDGGYDLSPERRAELSQRVERVFDKIFHAALEYKLETIVLSRFGAGAFAANYPGNILQEVWLPAFTKRLRAWKKRLHDGGVGEISMMGGPSQADAELQFAVTSAQFGTEVYGNFPDPLRTQLGGRLAKALVVNAWDCWSLIGNGNFCDNSLDGFVGRTSALAVLGWPFINPYMAQPENMIEVKG